MNWTYDTTLRRSGLSAMSGTNVLQAAGYTHDTAGRLWKVSDGSVEAAYGYAANSSLMSSLTMTNSGAAGLVANRVWDRLGRLTSVSTRAYGSGAPGLPFGFEYQYNRANQRTRMKLADGSYWLYQFDALGQVISGKRYWSDGTPVAGQQFEYGFDDIGNRESTGGRASAASSYTNNLLNQITGRSVAPYVDVAGVANPTTNVTVSAAGQTFTAARRGDYFHHALSVPNSSAQYPTVEVTSAFTNWTESGQVYVPATPEVFTYDADGNLTSDGRWAYTWDGENRLVEMKRDAVSPSGARIWLVFEYDAQGRRIRKTVSTNAGGGWVEQTDAVFLYDGWNVMVELNANSAKARLRTYVWGIDLSGTLQGAGGVGGLLWVNNYQTAYQEETLPTGVHFVAFDGNGNVMALVKAADGTVSGRYEYGPFAEPVRVSGSLGKAQPFRFSTKWTDAESRLVYYGYRYYSTTTGTWISRDPLGEGSCRNNRCFVSNTPVSGLDFLGLVRIRQEDDLTLVKNGQAIGTAKVVEYHLNSWASHFGATLVITVDVKDNKDCRYFRWRQHFTYTDQNGRFQLTDSGIVANNLLDPTPGNDDKEWYYRNTERPISPDGISEPFEDNPHLFRSRFASRLESPVTVVKLTVSFSLELVEVRNLDQKAGGSSVLNIEWGYQSDVLGRDRLIERAK